MKEKSLDQKIEDLYAVYEIQTIMSKYEYLLSSGRAAEIVDLFAQKAPGILANIGDWGAYKGIEGVRRLFAGLMGQNQVGFVAEADLSNPVIEIAGDGKTAKAVWMAPGIETLPDKVTGKPRAGWCYTKYACDFIKEDGEWKFWHFNNFLTFYCDFEKSWASGGEHYSRRAGSIQPPPPEFAPDGPPTHRHNPYDPKGKRELLPAFPEPYKTYNGSQDWIDPFKPEK